MAPHDRSRSRGRSEGAVEHLWRSVARQSEELEELDELDELEELDEPLVPVEDAVVLGVALLSLLDLSAVVLSDAFEPDDPELGAGVLEPDEPEPA